MGRLLCSLALFAACYIGVCLGSVAHSGPPPETVVQLEDRCPEGFFFNITLETCLKCPITCEDLNGVNGSCKLMQGRFVCALIDGLIIEAPQTLGTPTPISTGRLLRGLGLLTRDNDTGNEPTLANISIRYESDDFNNAYDELTAPALGNLVTSTVENGRTLIIRPAVGQRPPVSAFGDAVYSVTINDRRLEPLASHCFQLLIHDGVFQGEPLRLCAITRFVDDNNPEISCTSNARILDVEANQTEAVVLASCEVTDADAAVGRVVGFIAARGGGSDIRFNTSLSGSVSGVETNNLDLTFPAGISPENASAVINTIKVFAFLGASQEFDGHLLLRRNITIAVGRTIWPTNNAEVQVQLVPIPERKGAIEFRGSGDQYMEGLLSSTTIPTGSFGTNETFYSISSIAFDVTRTTSDPETLTPSGILTLGSTASTLNQTSDTSFIIKFTGGTMTSMMFSILQIVRYENLADEFDCADLTRGISITVTPFDRQLDGPSTNMAAITTDELDPFVTLVPVLDNPPELTLSPSSVEVEENGRVQLFEEASIMDLDNDVCRPQCFARLSFTVADPLVGGDMIEVDDPDNLANANRDAIGVVFTRGLNITETINVLTRIFFNSVNDNPVPSYTLNDIQLTEADECGVGGSATIVVTPSLTSTINITAINDPPTVDTNRDGLRCGATYFEGQAPLQLLDSMDSLSIQDPEMDYISSAVVSITSNLDPDDMLQPSSILMSFASVEFESGILTINYTTPLNVSSAQSNSQVLFSNSNGGLNVNPRNISVTFTDVNGATSIPHVFTLCICPVNDPPVMQASNTMTNISTVYEANKFRVEDPLMIGENAVVSDVDDINLSRITCQLSNAIFLAEGRESLSFGVGGTSVSVASQIPDGEEFTIIYTLTGGSNIAEYQTVLRTMAYDNMETEVPGQLNRIVKCTASDGALTSFFTILIDVVVIPAAHLQIPTRGARRTTIREGPISALGQNYTLLDGDSDFVMSFTISVLNEDGMPCPEACDPRNMIRLFFPGPVAGGLGVTVTGNGTARIFYTIVGFFRRVVPDIEALMRTVQITSDFVATEMVIVRSEVEDWPTRRMSAPVETRVEMAVVNRRPILNVGASACVEFNLTEQYLPISDDSPATISVDDIISQLSIMDSDEDDITAVTISAVALSPSQAAATLEYRRGPDADFRQVPGSLNGIVEPGVGVPLLPGFQLRAVPLPNQQKLSGCLEYTLKAYDNTSRNTSDLLPEEFSYSIASITCRICFEYRNRAPVRLVEEFELPTLFEDNGLGSRNPMQVNTSDDASIDLYTFNIAGMQMPAVPVNVSSILRSIASDADDMALSLALRNAETNDVGVFQYTSPDGVSVRNPIPNDLGPNEYVVLSNRLRLFFLPNLHATGTATIEARAYDGDIPDGRNVARFEIIDSGPSSILAEESTNLTQTVNQINDLPLIDLNGPDFLGLEVNRTYFEESDVVLVAPNAIIIDVESPTLTNLTISYPREEGDVVDASLPSSLNESITTENGHDGTVVTRVISAADGDAPKSEFQSYVRSLTFVNTLDEPSPSVRVFNFVAHDGKNAGDPPARANVMIVSVNDRPVLSPADGFELNFTEGSVSSDSLFPVTVTDADSPMLSSALIVLSGIANPGMEEIISDEFSDRLTILSVSSAGLPDFTSPPVTYRLALAGLNLSEASSALQSLRYNNTADEPLTGVRTVNLTVADNFMGPFGRRNPFGGVSEESLALVTIVPVNDQEPVFSQPQYDTCVPEGARNFTVTSAILATDGDINQPQVLTYNFICPGMDVDLGPPDMDGNVVDLGDGSGGSGMSISRRVCEIFSIDAESAEVMTCGGPLCAVPLRSVRSEFQIPLHVSDGTFNGTATLNITVVESNNNSPMFVGSKMVSVVESESFSPGSVFFQVEARDDDVFPPNNVLEYSLDNDFMGMFTIDPASGNISSSQAFNYEERCEFDLNVSVSDGAGRNPMCFFGGVLTSQCTYTVTVDNVNEFSPAIVDPGVLTPSESSQVENEIAVIIASDNDTGCPQRESDADIVTFSIVDDTSGLFDIGAQTGSVVLTGLLDFETAQTHTITVMASDNGSPVMSSTVVVTINVQNVNDNNPVLDQAAYAESINEATIIPTVLQFMATDADNLGPLVFSLENAPPSFSVATNGTLSVTDSSLDFEEAISILFTVRVSDGERFATAPVNITLRDLNDNTPLIRGIRNNTYTIKERPIALQPAAVIEDLDSIHAIDGVTITLSGVPEVTQRLSSELPCDCSAPAVGTCPNVTALNILELMEGPVPVVNGTATFSGTANTVPAASIDSSLVQGFVVSACVRIAENADSGYLITLLGPGGGVAFAIEINSNSGIVLSYLVNGVRQSFPTNSESFHDGEWHSFNLELRFPTLRVHIDRQPVPIVMELPLAMRPDGLPAGHSDILVGCHNARCFDGDVRALVLRLGVTNLLHFTGSPASFDGSTPLQFTAQAGEQVPVADVHIPGIRPTTTQFDIHVKFALNFTTDRSRATLISRGRSRNWIYGIVADSNLEEGTTAAFNVFHRICVGTGVDRENSFFDFTPLGGDLRTGTHEILAQLGPTEIVVILDRVYTMRRSLTAAQAPCFMNSIPEDAESLVFGAHLNVDGSTFAPTRMNGRIFNALVRSGNVNLAEASCLELGCGDCRCGGRCNNLPQCTANNAVEGCRFDISKYAKCGIVATDLLYLSGAGCNSGPQMVELTTEGPNLSLDAGVTDLPAVFQEYSGAAYFTLSDDFNSGVILVVPGVAAAMVSNRTTIAIFICIPANDGLTYIGLFFTLPVAIDGGLHHLAFSVSMNSVEVFVDGSSVGVQARPPNSGTSINGRIYLGFWPRTTRQRFVGTLQAITFSNQQLSAFQARCIESCGVFLTVDSLPQTITSNNLTTQLNTQIVLTGNEFENVYAGVVRTLTYYNLFSEPSPAPPFNHMLRIQVLDNGVEQAAATSESTVSVQTALPPTLLLGGDTANNTVIVENGASAGLVTTDVQVLIPVSSSNAVSISIVRILGGCEFDSDVLRLSGELDSTCATLEIVNGSEAVLSTTDPLNTLVTALRQIRYTCILPNMVTITTLFQLTLEVNQASAGVSRATLPDMPATAIVNVTSINNGPCSSAPCQNGATCVDDGNTFMCTCAPGFSGVLCMTNIDDCIPDQCENRATCVDGINDFTCQCPPGFTGNLCGVNIDECASRPCLNGTCTDGINEFTCVCTAGFTGDRCQVDIDECASVPCRNNGTCTDNINGFTCACVPGTSGLMCEVNIDECASEPCQNGLACQDLLNAFLCTCQPGFTGVNCETNINECDPDPCVNGICSDGINEFTCACTPGFTGVRCETNIDECASMPCRNNGTCTDNINGFTCTCVPGTTGLMCEVNIDECASEPCQNGLACQDLLNAFLCTCQPGFTGVNCETNINECDPDPCVNGICSDGINEFTCACTPGFTGVRCETNIDECDSMPCQNVGTCVDGINGFVCQCAAGFTGVMCEVNIDDCTSRPCLNGTCIDGINEFTCECTAGFTGDRCQTNIDECASTPCVNDGTCVDGIPGFTCQCVSGFTGRICGEEVDECMSDPCANGATCIDGLASVTCQCAAGFTGLFCDSNIDECASMPCATLATCIDGVDGFTCNCPAQFTGTLCETMLNLRVCDFGSETLLGTQADVVSEVTGCSSIAGRLVLNCENGPGTCDIDSLAPFSSVTVITGTFVIQNTQITSLEGLSGLTTLGTLTLDSNLQLASISGLFASVEVQCSLEAEAINIFNSPELISLAGLENVGIIQDVLSLRNIGVTSMAGLGCLRQAGGVNFNLLNDLVSLEGLDQLTTTGNFFLTSCPLVTELEALTSVTTVTGILSISNSLAILNLQGLRNLQVQPSFINLSGVCVQAPADQTVVDGSFLTNLPGVGGIVFFTRGAACAPLAPRA